VYSDNTDAFTIHADDLELAKSLLKVDNGIGSWRLTITADIAFPKVKPVERHNLKINIPNNQLNKLDIKNEYDREGMCQLL
jgi:hypothetical protein